MKISLIGPVYPYRGGIAHYTALLDRALREHGHQTQVISFKRQYPGWLYPGASDKDPSQRPLKTEAEFLLDPLYPWTWRQAARKVASFQPDLVTIQWWTTFWGPAYTSLAGSLRRKGYPVVYVLHNVLPHEKRPWDAGLARLALLQGKAFIAQTERERERLHALLPNRDIWLCPLPAYKIVSRDEISPAEARKRLGLPEDQPVLLFFGIVRPYKGLKHLLEALALAREAGKEVFLAVAGEFWEDKSIYLQQIERLQIGDRVRLTDRYVPDEEAELFFAAADALVAPYVGGTQSAAAGMALGCGLPLIVTEPVAAGIADANRGSLRVVPAGDSRRLAEAIAEFVESDAGRAPRSSLVETPASTVAPDDWWRLVQTLEDILAKLS